MKIAVLRNVFIFLIFFLPLATHAQYFEPGKGKAIIYFESNTKIVVRLDTALLQQTKQAISLKVGKYVVRAWAPTKELFVDTMNVVENTTTFVTRRLKNSEAYINYREQVKIYRFKKTVTTYLPLPLTLGYSVFMFKRYKDNEKLMNQHLENAKTAETNYAKPLSNSDIVKYKQEYDHEKSSYETFRTKNNQLVVLGISTVSAALVASGVLLYMSKKVVRPGPYTEIPLLSLNNLNVKSDYRSTCFLNMTLNINR